MHDEAIKMSIHICPVCGKSHSGKEIFIHKQLKPIKEVPITGTSLCEEHQKLSDDGYIALVVIDLDKSTNVDDTRLKPEDAYRTGDIMHMRREVYSRMFDNHDEPHDMTYIDMELYTKLKTMYDKAEQEYNSEREDE